MVATSPIRMKGAYESSRGGTIKTKKLMNINDLERQNANIMKSKSTKDCSMQISRTKQLDERDRPESENIADVYYCGSIESNCTMTERIVMDEDVEHDCIEIVNDGDDGLSLLHVIPKHNEDTQESKLPSNENSTPKSHYVISYESSSTNHHALCGLEAKHRIAIRSAQKGSNINDVQNMSPSDITNLLQSYNPINESDSVKRELDKCNREILALESESTYIQCKLRNGGHAHNQKCVLRQCQNEWDIDQLLDITSSTIGYDSSKLTLKQRRLLQTKRGLHFLASFETPKIAKNFAYECGGHYQDVPKSLNECYYSAFKLNTIAANAAAVCHVMITQDDDGSSFFLSRDDGKTFYDNRLPSRLRDRLSRSVSIKYLALGPGDSYYAKLQSGDSIWGMNKNDTDFTHVMHTFDVHRVAFGSFRNNESVMNDQGENDVITSWIVIGKDGRMAWRNIPNQLHKLLQCRTESMPSPCEISLGQEGAFFVKFLDGDIRYCVPSYIGDICDKIVNSGAGITNITLHPENPYAFVIRHTGLEEGLGV